MTAVRPPPYLLALRDYLKHEEPDLWRWFSSTKFRAEYADNVRLDLLKEAYRLDRLSHGPLHDQVDDVLRRLSLALPFTLYQSQLSARLNAALVFLPGEAHLLFSGPLLSTLAAPETGWVMAHELSHHDLASIDEGGFHTASQILHAMAGHRNAQPSHIQSLRLFQLYSEIAADRGALAAFPDVALAVSTLVKIETGLRDVSAASYLAQADEIFSKEKFSTKEVSHPEAFIRARALKLWSERGEEAETEIARMIEGAPALDAFDLVAQKRMTALTRRVIARCLARPALHSETLLAHARLFFDDFGPGDVPDREPVDLTAEDASVQTYVCHVLLDFAAADPALEEVPLAAALLESRGLGLEDRFLTLAARELKLKKKNLEKLKADAESILSKAEKAP